MVEAVFVGTLIPLLFLLLVLQGQNRLIMAFFTWGFAAFTLALFVNTRILALGISETHLAVTWAPVVEEFLKALPLACFLFSKKSARLPFVYLAMASGVGFSIQENYLYLFMEYGSGSQVLFMVIRSLTTCIMHGLTAAILGYGIQMVKKVHVFTGSAVFGLFALAVTIHALFNLFIDSPYNLIGMLFPMLLFLAGFLLMKDEVAE